MQEAVIAEDYLKAAGQGVGQLREGSPWTSLENGGGDGSRELDARSVVLQRLCCCASVLHCCSLQAGSLCVPALSQLHVTAGCLTDTVLVVGRFGC